MEYASKKLYGIFFLIIIYKNGKEKSDTNKPRQLKHSRIHEDAGTNKKEGSDVWFMAPLYFSADD